MVRTLAVCAVLNIAFAATSGLWGVMVTDAIQFCITMSSAFAASITVLPGGTCTFLPSISRFSMARPRDRPKDARAPWRETSTASFGGISYHT